MPIPSTPCAERFRGRVDVRMSCPPPRELSCCVCLPLQHFLLDGDSITTQFNLHDCARGSTARAAVPTDTVTFHCSIQLLVRRVASLWKFQRRAQRPFDSAFCQISFPFPHFSNTPLRTTHPIPSSPFSNRLYSKQPTRRHGGHQNSNVP